MSKMAVIYWSMTGNTQAMAEAIADGAREAGAQADLFSVDQDRKSTRLNSSHL